MVESEKEREKKGLRHEELANEVFFEDEVEMPFLTEAPSAIALRNMTAAERCFAQNGVRVPCRPTVMECHLTVLPVSLEVGTQYFSVLTSCLLAKCATQTPRRSEQR